MSWPIWEQSLHFELGHILNSVITDAIPPPQPGFLQLQHAGVWECDLKDEALIWSGGVYDLFGLPRGSRVTRAQALSHYCEDAFLKLERLRSYAIRHKRGFTLDVDIRHGSTGDRRPIRVIGAPVCEAGKVVRLHGLKLSI